MDEFWRWAIGLGVTLTLGWTTILIGIGNRFVSALRKLEDDLNAELETVKKEYVRRIDLDGHITRLGDDMKQLRAEVHRGQEATTQRLDAVLAALARKQG